MIPPLDATRHKVWFRRSKIVAEDGQPWVVFHGSPHGVFEKFRRARRGSGADVHGFGDWGNGFYFTPDRETAQNYARGMEDPDDPPKPTLYSVHLRMEKPFDLFPKYHAWLNECGTEHRALGNPFRVPLDKSLEIDNRLRAKFGLTEADTDLCHEIEGDLSDNWGDWDIARKLRAHGFDGVISPDGREYVVFHVSQIQIVEVESLSPVLFPPRSPFTNGMVVEAEPVAEPAVEVSVADYLPTAPERSEHEEMMSLF